MVMAAPATFALALGGACGLQNFVALLKSVYVCIKRSAILC
jgi:hypothetical protein